MKKIQYDNEVLKSTPKIQSIQLSLEKIKVEIQSSFNDYKKSLAQIEAPFRETIASLINTKEEHAMKIVELQALIDQHKKEMTLISKQISHTETEMRKATLHMNEKFKQLQQRENQYKSLNNNRKLKLQKFRSLRTIY